jgi:hypothetical protein
MRSAPQIRLRTLFLYFVCAAVGLTCGTSPPPPVDPTLAGLNDDSIVNWYYGLLSAASVAIVIGLIQQVICLRGASRSEQTRDANIALRFSIFWRAAIASTLLLCVVVRVGELYGFIELPETDLFISEIFPNCVWLICVFIVLSDSVSRCRPYSKNIKEPHWQSAAMWIAAVVLGLIVLPENASIHHLVYISLSGIEAAQPGKFHRMGAYDSQHALGYPLFWMSLLTMLLVVISAAILSWVAATPAAGSRRLKIACWLSTLVTVAVLCGRYYVVELRRLAPDIAEAGLPGNWLDWLGGAAIATIVVTAVAHRMARSESSVTVLEFAPREREGISLHESFFTQLVVTAASFAYFADMFRINFYLGGVATIDWPDFIRYVCLDPTTLLCIAIGAVSLHLIWLCWRRRELKIAWELPTLNARRFAWSWLAAAALFIVLIPAAAEYCFSSWLGPWYLYGPK